MLGVYCSGIYIIINMWTTPTVEKVDELYRFIDYLEGEWPIECKVARVRKFYGVDAPMDILKAVEDMWELEDTVRRELMEYILRELMGLDEEEIKTRMDRVTPFIDRLPEILKDL